MSWAARVKTDSSFTQTECDMHAQDCGARSYSACDCHLAEQVNASFALPTGLDYAPPGGPTDFTQCPVLVTTQMRLWSLQQEAIFAFMVEQGGHLVVRARAGTGKTTTIVEAVKQYCRAHPGHQVVVCAFNKRIADVLVPLFEGFDVVVQTLHALGFGIVREYWGGVRVAKGYDTRAAALTKRVAPDAPETIRRLISKLHTKGREILPYVARPADLLPLAEQFECDPEPFWFHQGYGVEYICEKALAAMDLAAANRPSEGIDFADMIFLPLRNKWAAGHYQLVVVDEAQDMTVAQLDLSRKVLAPDGRICVVGDDRQAIYGFRGADSGSLDRLKRELNATELGLTTTYRCGRSIVRMAQALVPDIEAGKDVSEGIIAHIDRGDLVEAAQPGDFILSRLNAPLAGVAMGLLRAGKRCEIAGKDIGNGLKAIVRKLLKGPRTISEFLESVEAWETQQAARALRLKFETRVVLIRDQAETLRCLTEGVYTPFGMEQLIERLFSDNGPNSQAILCSSVHKAKGLEANKVFVLDWTFRPGKNQEEDNIRYVAWTRARHELVFVQQ